MSCNPWKDFRDISPVESFRSCMPGGLAYAKAQKVKKQVNVRLTERGIMKLDELSEYFGVPRNIVVEWLVTLYHEKVNRYEGGENHETKGS